MIEAGRVSVNGAVSRDSTLRVSLEHDRIVVDGTVAVAEREPLVIALHKPVGYVTTRSDPQGRKSVYELLPALDRFVFPVGRLDMETSGLLIFTDDHRLGEALTNRSPAYRRRTRWWWIMCPMKRRSSPSGGCRYRQGQTTRPASADMIPHTSVEGLATLKITIDEGTNRQIRRMMAAVGSSAQFPAGTFVVLSPKDFPLLKSNDKRAL